MTRWTLLGIAFAALISQSALAEAQRTIVSPRIHLGDVSEGYEDGALATLDLGPAPPPGSSRLLSRAEVLDQLRSAGDDTKNLRMPSSVRVQSASKRWSVEELRQALTPKLIDALPPGLVFKGSKFSRTILTSPNVKVGSVHFPKFPKREGELTLTVTVDMVQEEMTVLRLPVTVVVWVTEAATRPAAMKGTRVTLIIEHGAARVTALATAMSDTELGGLALFRVASTQRVLRARLLSADSAQVVE